MAFTYVTVTCDYDLSDGTDPSGTVTFTSTAPMVNGGVTNVAAPVTRKVDVDGVLTISLAANTDPGTSPTGTAYKVDEFLNGIFRSYYVIVPHNAGPTVNLSTLTPATVPPTVTFPAVGPAGPAGPQGPPGTGSGTVLAPPPSGGNDTAMIQALLTTGGRVLLKAYATYVCSSTLTLNPQIAQLHGIYTTLDFSSQTTGNLLTVTATSAGNFMTPVLSGLTFQASPSASAGSILYFGGAGSVLSSSIIIENCSFKYGYDQLYFEANAYLIKFRTCLLQRAIHASVNNTQGSNAGENISFEGCNFSDCTGGTLVLCANSGASLKFTSCSFDYSARAINVTDGYILCQGCHFESNDASNVAGNSEYILVDGTTAFTYPTVETIGCMWSCQWSTLTRLVTVTERYATFISRGDRFSNNNGIQLTYVDQSNASFAHQGRVVITDSIYTYNSFYMPAGTSPIANGGFDAGLTSWTVTGVAPTVSGSTCNFSVTTATSYVSQIFPMRPGQAIAIDFRWLAAYTVGQFSWNVDYLDDTDSVLLSAMSSDPAMGQQATSIRYTKPWLNKGSGAGAMSNYFAPQGTVAALFRIGYMTSSTGTATIDDIRIQVV